MMIMKTKMILISDADNLNDLEQTDDLLSEHNVEQKDEQKTSSSEPTLSFRNNALYLKYISRSNQLEHESLYKFWQCYRISDAQNPRGDSFLQMNSNEKAVRLPVNSFVLCIQFLY